MLFLTPKRIENGPLDPAPAVQVNAMKFPSKNALTDIYKVNHNVVFVLHRYYFALMTFPVLNFYL